MSLKDTIKEAYLSGLYPVVYSSVYVFHDTTEPIRLVTLKCSDYVDALHHLKYELEDFDEDFKITHLAKLGEHIYTIMEKSDATVQDVLAMDNILGVELITDRGRLSLHIDVLAND